MTDTTEQTTKFKELIDNSNKILITSHVSPDPDSISSILLLGTTLRTNYPNKQITMFSEELPENLSYLPGFNDIKSGSLKNVIDQENPALIIMVDAMNFVRCSRDDAREISQKLKENNTPLAIIDHHEAVGVEDNEAYINEGYPAAVQQVYETCFNQLNLQKPEGYAETTMTGLYSDTGGFAYFNDKYKETLVLITALLDAGVRVEGVKNRLYQYTEDQMKIVAELATNISHNKDYSYTFLSDEFIKNWTEGKMSLTAMHTATKIFTDNFIRNIEGRSWGFLIYADSRLGDNWYSISLRSVGGKPDVASVAGRMSGGGHKAASGARVQANSVQEAIKKVQEVITETL
jgi:phosphoesterase RecJ-like protein